ncbi:hypothetical protein D4S03_10495 [bacterium]|nr:MAG: hypothetical protein D4S03_10495 [bacterium]
MNFIEVAKKILLSLLVVLLATLVWAVVSVAMFMRQATETASQFAQVAQESRAGLRDTLGQVNAATIAWRVYSEELTAFLRSTETKTNLALGGRALRNLDRAVINLNQGITEIREDVRKLDENVNSTTGLLPALTATILKTEAITEETVSAISEMRRSIETASADLHGTAAGLDATLDGMRRAADSATAAIEQMRVVAADPAITASLRQIEATTTKSAETMANVEAMTRRMAKPANLAWRVLREIVVLTGRVFAP